MELNHNIKQLLEARYKLHNIMGEVGSMKNLQGVMGRETKVSTILDQLGDLGMAIDREIGWQLHLTNNIEGTNRDIYVSLVLHDSDNAEELAKEIASKIEVETGTLEELT